MGLEAKECYMENLRKVAFTLEQQKMNLFDYETEEEREMALRKRNGFFHCFGNAPFYDSEGECLRDRMVGIVEEEGTGKVYHVVPEFITFVP